MMSIRKDEKTDTADNLELSADQCIQAPTSVSPSLLLQPSKQATAFHSLLEAHRPRILSPAAFLDSRSASPTRTTGSRATPVLLATICTSREWTVRFPTFRLVVLTALSGNAYTLQLPFFKGLLDYAGTQDNFDLNLLGDYSTVRCTFLTLLFDRRKS